MGNLSVRRLDEETLSRLRVRAARNGVSMEEARRILREAVNAPERLGDLALEVFGRRHGVDLEPPERAPHDPPDLGDVSDFERCGVEIVDPFREPT